ncbi:hypothetical protein A3Q56_03195 [Intoshia linei]|uniref:SAP domain-containing protein n=1 Tax=Intoshia linei TaxID=1819745 RepID=A0A177B437_9BILA|nr:hypothetical protein A3Q56_03195 [Intoshia linei]
MDISQDLKDSVINIEQAANYLNNHISNRPNKKILIDNNILDDEKCAPILKNTGRFLKRVGIANKLNSSISSRPGPLELIESDILQYDDSLSYALKDGQISYQRAHEDDIEMLFAIKGQSLLYDNEKASETSFVRLLNFWNHSKKVDADSLKLLNENLELSNFNKISANSTDKKKFFTVKDNYTAKTPQCVNKEPSSFKIEKSSPVWRSKCKNSNTPIKLSSLKPASAKPLKILKFHHYTTDTERPRRFSTKTMHIKNLDHYSLLLKQQDLFLRWQSDCKNQIKSAEKGIKKTNSHNNRKLINPPVKLFKYPCKKKKCLTYLNIKQLRSEASKRGLKVYGPKASLVERLQSYKEEILNEMSNCKCSTCLKIYQPDFNMDCDSIDKMMTSPISQDISFVDSNPLLENETSQEYYPCNDAANQIATNNFEYMFSPQYNTLENDCINTFSPSLANSNYVNDCVMFDNSNSGKFKNSYAASYSPDSYTNTSSNIQINQNVRHFDNVNDSSLNQDLYNLSDEEMKFSDYKYFTPENTKNSNSQPNQFYCDDNYSNENLTEKQKFINDFFAEIPDYGKNSL